MIWPSIFCAEVKMATSKGKMVSIVTMDAAAILTEIGTPRNNNMKNTADKMRPAAMAISFLAHTNVVGNMLFGSISGSSVAAAAAIGGVMSPLQEKEGYDRTYSAAVNIASAPTGLLIPPSGLLIPHCNTAIIHNNA